MKELHIAVAAKREQPQLEIVPSLLVTFLTGLQEVINAQQKKFTFNMLNGLADGGDMLCAVGFNTWRLATGNNGFLTGVYPFKLQDYLKTIANKQLFMHLYSTCREQVFLDGTYLEGPEPRAKLARSQAYRAQAEYLVKHADFFIAVADETDPVKPGGTLETITHALQVNIPVVFFSLHTERFMLLQNAGAFAASGEIETRNPVMPLENIISTLVNRLNILPGNAAN